MYKFIKVALYMAVFVSLLLLAWWGWSDWYPTFLSIHVKSSDGSKYLQDRGLFGDSYGAFNALITAFAFAAFVATLLFQAIELNLQRKQLELQRQEMANNASALNRQATAIEAQMERELEKEQPNIAVFAKDASITESGKSLILTLINLGHEVSNVAIKLVPSEKNRGQLALSFKTLELWPKYGKVPLNFLATDPKDIENNTIILDISYVIASGIAVRRDYFFVTAKTTSGIWIEFHPLGPRSVSHGRAGAPR